MEQGELHEVPAVQGQRPHLGTGDQAGDVRAHRFHRYRRHLHRHHLGHVAGGELDVDGPGVGHVEGYPAADLGLEPGVLHLDAIAAHGQLREGIDPRGGRGAGAREAGVLVLDRDLGPRDHRSRGIGHRPADGAGDLLGVRGHRDQEGEKRSQVEPLLLASPPQVGKN